VLTSAIDVFPFESVCRIGFLLSYNGVEIVLVTWEGHRAFRGWASQFQSLCRVVIKN
jgi:hypothetical protein